MLIGNFGGGVEPWPRLTGKENLNQKASISKTSFWLIDEMFQNGAGWDYWIFVLRWRMLVLFTGFFLDSTLCRVEQKLRFGGHFSIPVISFIQNTCDPSTASSVLNVLFLMLNLKISLSCFLLSFLLSCFLSNFPSTSLSFHFYLIFFFFFFCFVLQRLY